MLSIKNTDVVVVNHREHGRRLIFKNNLLNPRDELGKFGVSYSRVAIEGCIGVEMNAIYDGNEAIRKKLWLNRKSLKKYLMAMRHLPESDLNKINRMNDADLIGLLNSTMLVQANFPGLDENQFQAKKREIEASYGDNGLRHVGEHNQRPLFNRAQSLSNRFFGSFYSWLYRKTVSGVKRLMVRFAILHKEKNYFKRSEQLALARFKEAEKEVPGYQQFLTGKLAQDDAEKAQNETFSENHQRKDKALKFSDIPLTKKSNYITPLNQKSWKTHKRGQYPDQFKVDTSTGTTGNPTVWHRSNDEIKTVKQSMITFGQMRVGGRNVYAIDAFALGPWATGLSVYEMGREMGSVFAPGADADKILGAIDNQYRHEQHCLKRQVKHILKSVPGIEGAEFKQEVSALMVFMNSMLCKKLDDKDLSLKAELKAGWAQFNQARGGKYKKHFNAVLRALVALDKQRPKMMLTGYPPFLQKLVSYAEGKGLDFAKYRVQAGVGGQAISESARDNLIRAGFTSVTSSFGASDLDINIGIEEVEIRKVMHAKPEMQRELYGAGKGVPMVFRYDPLNYHIECDKTNNHLIFTSNRDNRSSPRVRYDIQDNGRVYAASDVHAMLAKHGVFRHEGDKHNLPYLFIWGRESTAPWGTTNVPFDILESAVNKTLPGQAAKFAFYKYQEENQDRFEIWIELKSSISEVFSSESMKEAHANIINEMMSANEYFKEEIERLADGEMMPSIRFFNPGVSPIAEPDGQRKQVLVFENGANCNIEAMQASLDDQSSVRFQLEKGDFGPVPEPTSMRVRK